MTRRVSLVLAFAIVVGCACAALILPQSSPAKSEQVALSAANLTPYQPIGWSDKIVVSRTTGTNTDSAQFTNADELYVDWAVINSGNAATTAAFYTYLYVDGGFRDAWSKSAPLNASSYTSAQDYPIGILSAGTHTIQIVADATAAVGESNESDNQYIRTITVIPEPRPNLTPYQPAGWSDKIVVSRETGTNTDSTELISADTLYVDCAVVNNGNAATTTTFYTYLYVDGSYRYSWSTSPPFNASSYTALNDYAIGKLSSGAHTIQIVADATAGIAESNESDNQYTRTIHVVTSPSKKRRGQITSQ